MKDFIKNTWPLLLVFAVVVWVDHYHAEDIPTQLKALGFLVLLGIVGIYDKLSKIQFDPRVRVDVLLLVRVGDNIRERESLKKTISFSIPPQVGDYVSDAGYDIGEVTSVVLLGIGVGDEAGLDMRLGQGTEGMVPGQQGRKASRDDSRHRIDYGDRSRRNSC